MKRFLDILFSLIAIIGLSPLLIVICIFILKDSKGPIFYRQIRVGKNSKDFSLLKFRTMKVNADKLGLLTVGERDNRITKVGYFLRKYKLDELPQLINVIVGEMSVVGPRPEVRKYVNLYTKEQQKVLSVRPGISDWASIKFKDENSILAQSSDPEKTYIDLILPQKIKLNLIYIENPSVNNYMKIIRFTIKSLFK